MHCEYMRSMIFLSLRIVLNKLSRIRLFHMLIRCDQSVTDIMLMSWAWELHNDKKKRTTLSVIIHLFQYQCLYIWKVYSERRYVENDYILNSYILNTYVSNACFRFKSVRFSQVSELLIIHSYNSYMNLMRNMRFQYS